jgi:hypothetical protein
MRIRIGEGLKADEAHEFINFVALLGEQAARDEAGLNVLSDGQPWKEVWVLEDEATFGAWVGDPFVANPKLARIWKIESGDETEESGFPAAAGTDNGNEFARGEREENGLKSQDADFRLIGRREIFGDADDAERSAFVGGLRTAARSASGATFA